MPRLANWGFSHTLHLLLGHKIHRFIHRPWLLSPHACCDTCISAPVTKHNFTVTHVPLSIHHHNSVHFRLPVKEDECLPLQVPPDCRRYMLGRFYPTSPILWDFQTMLFMWLHLQVLTSDHYLLWWSKMLILLGRCSATYTDTLWLDHSIKQGVLCHGQHSSPGCLIFFARRLFLA